MADRQSSSATRFLREGLAPQWSWFALGTLFAAVSAVCAFGYSSVISISAGWLETGDARALTTAPFLILLLVLLRAPMLYGVIQANNHGVQNAVVRLQESLFAGLIDGDFARLQSKHSGEFVSQFANDMVLVREAALRVATSLAKSTLTVLAALIFMLTTDWLLTLVMLTVYPVAIYPVVALGSRIRKSSHRAQEQAGELTSVLNEAFQGIRTVKAFGLEGYQKDRASRGFVERARLYMKVLRAKALVDPLLEVVGGLALAGLFAFAGWRALSGEITVGDLLGIIAAIGIASPEVRALGTLNAVVNEGLAAISRVYSVIDAPRSVDDRPGALDLGRSRGEVVFDGVAFSYPGADPALTSLSFKAGAGETVALVGASGAGKSTVFSLLLRLYDVSGGIISIDGHDIRDVRKASLRRNCALVSQDAFLFDATVKDNIRLGQPDASEESIKAAASAAACDFIEDLPGRWDAQVGEGGRNLSGGQRQRIALARALLSDAPVLLLDEATSALDSESEARIQAALSGLRGVRTVIVIAHRLATVRNADRIYVMAKGKCVESGAHADLLSQGGVYAGLVASQLS